MNGSIINQAPQVRFLSVRHSEGNTETHREIGTTDLGFLPCRWRKVITLPQGFWPSVSGMVLAGYAPQGMVSKSELFCAYQERFSGLWKLTDQSGRKHHQTSAHSVCVQERKGSPPAGAWTAGRNARWTCPCSPPARDLLSNFWQPWINLLFFEVRSSTP